MTDQEFYDRAMIAAIPAAMDLLREHYELGDTSTFFEEHVVDLASSVANSAGLARYKLEED